jgi:hypothetical protein
MSRKSGETWGTPWIRSGQAPEWGSQLTLAQNDKAAKRSGAGGAGDGRG